MAEQKQLNIYQRLNEVRSEVGYLQKDGDVQGYKAVTHDLVTSAVREHLIAQGVMVVPRQMSGESFNVGSTKSGTPIIRYEATYEIDFVNCDDPQDRVTVVQHSHANDHGDKAPGKACSYAVKYAMLKLFSIETGENEESRIEIANKQQPITEEQAKTIKEKLTATESNLDKFLEVYKVRRVEDIPSGWYDDVVGALDRKAQSQALKNGEAHA